MRIFLAGASGVIGVRLIPLLLADGHVVAGMTRTPERADELRALGADPVVCDVFDAGALTAALVGFAPDGVMHQLTDLPDVAADIPAHRVRNDRIRTEGTRLLVAAAAAAGSERLWAQSVAWTPAGGGATVARHEQQVLDAGGLVIRYGQLHGPGTYYDGRLPAPPRVHVARAARATVALLDAPPGIVVLTDEGVISAAPSLMHPQSP